MTNSLTTTQTTSSTSGERLHLTLNQNEANPQVEIKAACDRALNELTQIFVEYETWNDPLSEKLFEWGANVLKFDTAHESEFSELFHTNVRNCINQLATEILVNPLGGGQLQTPILVDEEWVWEAAVLSDYINSCPGIPVNPLSRDKQPIQNIIPHAFAQKMIQWTKKINSFISTFDFPSVSIITVGEQGALMSLPRSIASSSSAMTSPSAARQIAFLKFNYYTVLAQNVLTKRELQLMRTEIEQGTRSVALFREQLQAMIRQERDLAESRARAHEHQLNEHLETIQEAHTTEVTVLNERINDGLHQIRNTQEQVTLAEQNCHAREEQIRQLLQEEIRNAQLAEAHQQQMTQQLGQIQSTHQGHVTVLNSRIDDETRSHQRTRGQLGQEQQKTREQEAAINQLRQAYAQKAAEVEQIRQQNRNNRGSRCSVM